MTVPGLGQIEKGDMMSQIKDDSIDDLNSGDGIPAQSIEILIEIDLFVAQHFRPDLSYGCFQSLRRCWRRLGGRFFHGDFDHIAG